MQALLDHGAGADRPLAPRGGAAGPRPGAGSRPGTAWLARLGRSRLSRRASGRWRGILSQADLFQQVTRVLQALAREHPLLLVLDDLQWADAGSIALLFHLGRRLAGSRILVLGAYRPEEVAQGREGQRHPLEPVLHEFERTWGESPVDLAQAEGRRFVERWWIASRTAWGAAFREALYRHTGGHALFTVELWRGLQERGDLLRDERGCWVEGPALNWEQLPRRVEAVIAAHIARLPREWQELLTVASVEGEEFTAEVVARVQGHATKREVLRALSGALSAGASPGARAAACGGVGEQRLSRYRFRHYPVPALPVPAPGRGAAGAPARGGGPRPGGALRGYATCPQPGGGRGTSGGRRGGASWPARDGWRWQPSPRSWRGTSRRRD